MKKTLLFLISLLIVSSMSLKADEGMWLLSYLKKLNQNKMEEMGLQLTADDIYNVNKSSLKDAVVGLSKEEYGFRFSCTAELISPNGLFLTNHHCGYEEVQEHSSVENNYVDDGFWARSLKEELANPGKTAIFLVEMKDVTSQIQAVLTESMTKPQRDEAIEKISEELKTQAVDGTHYKADVKSFFEGNNHFLFIYETFLDVRLVGTPPSSIGKFGGDTDNWMWPRHTGDFCMFRIYTAPDGKPAKYSQDNIPLKSKHYLPISIKGVEEDDFAMIMGYPGGTDRYMTSFGIDQTMTETNAIRIKARNKKLAILKQDMDADKETFIKYTAKYNQSSNYWKYSIGQNQGLKRLNVIEKKQGLEAKLQKWINENEERKQKYGEALELIENAYIEGKSNTHVSGYLNEAIFEGAEIVTFAYNAIELYSVVKYAPDNTEAYEQAKASLQKEAKDFFKDYNKETDKKLLSAMFKIFYDNVPVHEHPEIFGEILENYGDFDSFADELYSTSIFADEQVLQTFLNQPNIGGTIWNASKVIPFTSNSYYLHSIMKLMPDTSEFRQTLIDQLKTSSAEYFKDLDIEKEKTKFADALKKFRSEVPKEFQPDIFIQISKDYNNDIDKFVNTMFKKSLFINQKKFDKFIAKPNLKDLENDVAFKTMAALHPYLKTNQFENDLAFRTMISVIQKYREIYQSKNPEKLEKGKRLFVAALIEMNKDKTYYPDANSTMRLSYGKVGGYKARDAVRYKHFTTLKGLIEKEDSTNDEFIVPQKLKQLYDTKDYGRYADNGQLKVCFTTNNDITGGNSGSPVINGNGELIGIAFDGNWEAMSGDIAFEDKLQKTICVDIRYVLFVIDKFAGAKNLIDEMKIVK